MLIGCPLQVLAESNDKLSIYNKLSEGVSYIPLKNQRGLSRVDTPSRVETSPRIDTFKLMSSIITLADKNYAVKLTSSKKQYIIKKDFLNLIVYSDKTGYLTLLTVGSSGNIFQLFPNNIDKNNNIEAGKPLKLPRTKWRIRSNGPAGINRFIAVITSSPNKFEGIGIPAGPYFKFDNTETTIAKFIARLSAEDNYCSDSNEKARDFIIEDTVSCDPSYGAAIVDINEIETTN